MNMNANDMVIGFVAGLATALLCLGVATGSGLSVTLYLLSAVPIMVAGLGWGLRASLIAVAISSVAVVLVANTQTAIFVLLTTSIPGAAVSYWLTLSRPAEEVGGPAGKLVWFPLADVLLRLCVMIGVAFIIIGVMIDYGPEMLDPLVDQIVARVQVTDPEFAFTDTARAEFLSTLTALIPFMQPLVWTMILVGNIYIASKITAASGQLRRPKDDYPSQLFMPKLALIVFGGALLLSFLSGAIGLVGTAVAGGLFAGFLLAGFALFHAYSRGKPWRTPALILLYGATFFMMLPAFIMFLIGLFTASRRRSISIPPNQSNE